jgi:integrase
MVAKVHRVLHRALRDAVKWNRIARNPAELADPPRAPRRDLKAWSAAELATFLAHASTDRLAALWQLLATTGLRRAEALGLRWEDLDLEERRLSVRQTLAYVGTRPEISETKAAKSRRLVMLDEDAVTALKAHRARQAR